jgi:aspartate oxidase
MRKLTFLLTFFMLLGSVQLQAKEYAIKDIPMVHLQNRTRYVITRMAIERKESRGLHYTIDYPVHAYDKKDK